MAITRCPECNEVISSYAITCPHCGYPVKAQAENNATDGIVAILFSYPYKTSDTIYKIVNEDNIVIAKANINTLYPLHIEKPISIRLLYGPYDVIKSPYQLVKAGERYNILTYGFMPMKLKFEKTLI